MDIIVLAAGANTRLYELGLASGSKPLVIIDGEPLIQRTVRTAMVLHPQSRVYVVASPQNYDTICGLVPGTVHVLVQTAQHGGVQGAVDLAMKVSTHQRIMLIMGDNVFNEGDLGSKYLTTNVIGVKTTDDTALKPLGMDGGWHAEPGSACTVHRWCGPVWFARSDWVRGHESWEEALPTKFRFHTVEPETMDIGTPAALRDRMQAEAGLTIREFFDQCAARQERLNEMPVSSMDGDRRAMELRNNILAAVVELVEAMNTVKWKPWMKNDLGRPLETQDERSNEVADIFLFVMNAASYMLPDVNIEDLGTVIEEAIVRKSKIVDDRLGNDKRDV